MNIELAIRKRLLVCALILMLTPFGISLPTFARAAQAEESTQVEIPNDDDASIRATWFEDYPEIVDRGSSEPTYGVLLNGGTVALHEAVWDARPSDDRADRPYVKPDWPWPPPSA